MKDWKTTLSGIGAAVFSVLTLLAALPYQLGDLATFIPSKYKETVFVVAASAAFILKVINSVVQKDKPSV